MRLKKHKRNRKRKGSALPLTPPRGEAAQHLVTNVADGDQAHCASALLPQSGAPRTGEDLARYCADLRQAGQIDAAEASVASAIAEFPEVIDIAIESFWLAWTRRDLNEALYRCETLRQRFPDNVAGHALGLMALRAANRIQEAETLAEVALARFAGDVWFRSERGLLPLHQRSWDEAIRRFAALRESFPEAVDGYNHGIAALREAGRFDEADALAELAMSCFGDNPEPVMEHVWIACARQDWPEALRRCHRLCEHYPDHLGGLTLRLMVLREAYKIDEAETLAAFALARFPNEPSIYLEWALLPVHQRLWAEATLRFAALRDRFPWNMESYCFGALALREAGRLDEADALARSAMIRFVSEPGPAIEHVWIACARRDWSEALQGCERLRERFPDHVAGFSLGIMVLRNMNRVEHANELALLAQSRFPNEPALWVEHAVLAVHQADRLEATNRFDEVRRRFPNVLDGYSHGAAALRAAEKFDEAESIVEAGIARFPRSVDLWRERGMVAMGRRDFSLAAQRWAAMRDTFPDQFYGYAHGIETLRELGEFEGAEVLAQEAISRFPDQAEVAVEHAQVASKKRDWPEALRRWTLAAERFPDNPGVLDGILEFKLDSIGDEQAEPAVVTEAEGDLADLRDLFLSFEGLGDNCEFGNVQRHFGAEPLGLLRWAGILPEDLIRSLQNRFDGCGDPATTELAITEPGPGYAGGDYIVRDLKCGFEMHSLVSSHSVTEETVLKQTYRRMHFLREKLLRDLEAGDKIFVYKRRDGTRLTEDEIARLHAGVRSNGPATLLCVQLEDEAHRNGLVEHAGDGLLIGYIDRLVETANGEQIAYDSWLSLCQAARALVPARAGASM